MAMNFKALWRLITETTFMPLFIGLSALATALPDGGWFVDVGKHFGAFLVAISLFRHNSELWLGDGPPPRTQPPPRYDWR
jgi:hypothetical protein